MYLHVFPTLFASLYLIRCDDDAAQADDDTGSYEQNAKYLLSCKIGASMECIYSNGFFYHLLYLLVAVFFCRRRFNGC